MIYPRPLKPGDAVAILSPASAIKNELVDSACKTLESWGFRPVVCPHCKGSWGSYSGTVDERIADIREALADESVRAILCSRGGYGVVHLLEHFEPGLWQRDPKWVMGFSDISAFHAALARDGVASIHSPMCKHLTNHPDDESSRALRAILTGTMPDYRVEPDKRNRFGVAEGQIYGGNIAVLSGLLSTDFNILRKDHILFIEDIDEAIYSIERMLYHLRLSGVLASTRALIVGQFTEYKPSKDFDNMYDMVQRIVADYDFPVAYNFPVGHVDHNLPIVEGSHAHLEVAADGVRLTLSQE